MVRNSDFMIKTFNKISRLENKGISSAAAAVIIATISVTLIGTTYFFSQGLTETAMAETFEVIDIFQNRIIVRNTGTQPISKFKALIDGKEVKNEIKDSPIQSQSVGTVIIDLEGITPGRHQLTLVSRSMSQTWMWEFEIVTTTIATTTLEITTIVTTPDLGEASIEANVETEQGIAEIEKPVKWISEIIVDNPSTVEIKGYKIGLIVPEGASNVMIKDPKENVISEETSFMVSVASKENKSYYVEYETPAPYKEENIIEPFTSGKKYKKKIVVESDFIGHYKGVKAFTDIPEQLSQEGYSIRLYQIKGESRTDVTDFPQYNVSFVDSDSNNLFDKIEWVVPTLSRQTFEISGYPIIFERDLICHKCGKHKAPPLTDVNMTISAKVSSLVYNAILIDYYPNEWVVVDANGGIVSEYNSTYDKIEWGVGSVETSVSRWYMIKSPQKTSPPTKYYFQSELNTEKSDVWMVIVADPVIKTRAPGSCGGDYTNCSNAFFDDSNYANRTSDGSGEWSNYGFNLGAGYTVSYVKVPMKHCFGGSQHSVTLAVWDGYAWSSEYNVPTSLSCPTTDMIDVSDYIDQPSEVNAIKVRLTLTIGGGPSGNKWHRVYYIPVQVEYTLAIPGKLNVNLTNPDPGVYTESNPLLVNQYSTFTVNSTVTCKIGYCGDVFGTIRYNETGPEPNELISLSKGATPFYLVDEPPETLLPESPNSKAYSINDTFGSTPGSANTAFTDLDYDKTNFSDDARMTVYADQDAGSCGGTVSFDCSKYTSSEECMQLAVPPGCGPGQCCDWITTQCAPKDCSYITQSDRCECCGCTWSGGGISYGHLKFTFNLTKEFGITYSDIEEITYYFEGYFDNESAGNFDGWLKYKDGSVWITGHTLTRTEQTYSKTFTDSFDDLVQGGVFQFGMTVRSATDDATVYGYADYAHLTVKYKTNKQYCGALNANDACQLNWTINVTGAVNTAYKIDVNFSSSSSSVTENDTDDAVIKITDTTPPKWSDNSTNNTIAGRPTEFSLRWTDNVGLDSYIFSFDNCTGTLSNITTGTLSGTNDWSNVGLVINSTEGCTIRWKVYANDTSDNRNVSDEFSFVTLSTIPYIEVNLRNPDPGVYIDSNPLEVTQYTTFVVNATVTCRNDDCDEVNGTVRYNSSGGFVPINETIGGFPLYVSDPSTPEAGTNEQTCGSMSEDETCQLNWTVNATGTVGKGYKIDVNFSSSSVTENDTDDAVVKIADQTPPKWSNSVTYPTSPTTYSPAQNYQFNVTWQDLDTSVDVVQIEHNFNGVLANYTVTTSQGSEYYYDYSDLSAGVYVWRMYANNTYGSENRTDQWTYIVQPGSSEAWLYLNGTRDNLDMNATQYLNTTAILQTPSSGYIEIWTNYSDGQWKIWDSGDSPLENITQINEEGIWNFTANFTNANYTPSYESWYVNVTLINQPPKIWNLTTRNENDVEIDETITGRIVIITVNASDPDNDIDYIEGNFTWPNGTMDYENLTASPVDKPYMYNWTYVIHPNMPNGSAFINVTVYDQFGLANSTNTTLKILPTKELGVYNDPVNFSTVNPGQNVIAIENQGWPLKVTVGGNIPLNISQMGEEYLTGATMPSIRIYIRNITWNQSEIGIFSQLSPSFIIVNESINPGGNQLIYYKMYVPSVEPQKYGGNITIKGEET